MFLSSKKFQGREHLLEHWASGINTYYHWQDKAIVMIQFITADSYPMI